MARRATRNSKSSPTLNLSTVYKLEAYLDARVEFRLDE